MAKDKRQLRAEAVERDYVRAEDYNDLALLRAQAERERDEWKAKAEQARESYLDAKHDRDAWHERYVELQGPGKARAGSSNLEWMYETDCVFQTVCAMFAEHKVIALGLEDESGPAREWLMSEHVDESSRQDTDRGERPEAPDCGSYSGTLEPWNPGTLEPDTSQVPMFDAPKDGGEAAMMSVEASIREHSTESESGERASESDSREKLEADAALFVTEAIAQGWERQDENEADIIALLDRQAAITDRKWREYHERKYGVSGMLGQAKTIEGLQARGDRGDKRPTVCAVCGDVFAREQRNQRRCPACKAAKPRWTVGPHRRYYERYGHR